MANGWTKERQERQAKLIHQWKPWKTAGVKTLEGKAISKMNAYKNGRYSASIRKALRFIIECKQTLSVK